MNKEAFKSWLTRYRTRNNKPLDVRTIDSRIANCVTVERAQGNLDEHFDRDGMRDLLNRLKYTSDDQQKHVTPKHAIPIKGDIYNGTATLRSAVLLYKRFLEYKQGNTHDLAEFFRRASFYRYHENFDDYERLYKIRLANQFLECRSLLCVEPRQSLLQFRHALQSKDNNIIDWRQHTPLLQWSTQSPEDLIDNLNTLWNDTIRLDIRFDSFCEALNRNNIRQTGSHLAIVSTLLMTLSAIDHPPVKTECFSSAMRLAGWDGFTAKQNAFEKYQRAIEFVDWLRKVSHEFEVELRDRLDAQAVVWCVSGGWPRVPVPTSWKNDPEHRRRIQELTYSTEFNELASEASASQLTHTEKLILVQSRRGQGWFREQLVKLWNCCSVTECSDLTFLRASHIRPWGHSDNDQRLDPYNGFLLSPNLDVAFDAGLITFDEKGQIEISSELRAKDRKLLGIHPKLCLRTIDPRHLPYLSYHRTEVFKKKPARKRKINSPTSARVV